MEFVLSDWSVVALGMTLFVLSVPVRAASLLTREFQNMKKQKDGTNLTNAKHHFKKSKEFYFKADTENLTHLIYKINQLSEVRNEVNVNDKSWI